MYITTMQSGGRMTMDSSWRQYYPTPCPREHFYRLADAGNLPADLWWFTHRDAQRAVEAAKRPWTAAK